MYLVLLETQSPRGPSPQFDRDVIYASAEFIGHFSPQLSQDLIVWTLALLSGSARAVHGEGAARLLDESNQDLIVLDVGGCQGDPGNELRPYFSLTLGSTAFHVGSGISRVRLS